MPYPFLLLLYYSSARRSISHTLLILNNVPLLRLQFKGMKYTTYWRFSHYCRLIPINDFANLRPGMFILNHPYRWLVLSFSVLQITWQLSAMRECSAPYLWPTLLSRNYGPLLGLYKSTSELDYLRNGVPRVSLVYPFKQIVIVLDMFWSSIAVSNRDGRRLQICFYMKTVQNSVSFSRSAICLVISLISWDLYLRNLNGWLILQSLDMWRFFL